MDDPGDATQAATQEIFDPRRLGRNNSGLAETDISDVICILHPSSPAACRIVEDTALRSPQHVLFQGSGNAVRDNIVDPEEEETFIEAPTEPELLNVPSAGQNATDIALRFSSRTRREFLGFAFGRNASMCDIVLGMPSVKRVSNLHFRIYLNEAGIVMLEDTSTNGTMVDNVLLKGKRPEHESTRMLSPGSLIQILSPVEAEKIRFIVRIPSREGHEEAYGQRFLDYMTRVEAAHANALPHQARPGQVGPSNGTGGGVSKRPFLSNTSYTHGMRWNGGETYNVVGRLGQGAFATVYKLATAMDGVLLAAKELEKRRFMKNGQLDQKLDNEMRIMQELKHPNIVEYKDYCDVGDNLYIIMEYVPCGDLQGYLQQRGVLPEPEAREMSRQILSSLVYLHNQKITHRDIKPDNILIASLDPFVVKLSDFGLSKVVKNNETFLKTFCGTLLYCAPEVFPHYEAHAATKRTKRRRNAHGHRVYHSYSSSVDIWSYAAVLWFALCGSPPFEGVADHTGRGMFEKIMNTPLDPTPLIECGVSAEAIDLLLKMLNTDPAARPTEQDCLRHPWLDDGSTVPEQNQLDVIEEEEDADSGAAGAEQPPFPADAQLSQLSQLSIHEFPELEDGEDELEFDDNDFDFLDELGRSKRVKTDGSFPRHRRSSQGGPEPHSTASPKAFEFDEIRTPRRQKPRLFGEIGESAFESSGILGDHTNLALSIDGSSVTNVREDGYANDQAASGASSLLGAESMVRDLHMTSAASTNLPQAPPTEPTIPRTPDGSQHPSTGIRPSQEETPKAKPTYSRQIHLPRTASYYYDPYRPETHTLEYASKVSGRDFVSEAKAARGTSVSIPNTMSAFSQEGIELGSEENSTCNESEADSEQQLPTPQKDDEFVHPPVLLGKLSSTKDSFVNIVLRMEERKCSWGRKPGNSHTYEDVYDTRIPKQAFALFYYADEIKAAEAAGRDWTTLDDLEVCVYTRSRNGIRVNGVYLPPVTSEGKIPYGHLRSADVLTIFEDPRKGEKLEFQCEFYHGKAADPRAKGERFEVLTKPDWGP